MNLYKRLYVPIVTAWHKADYRAHMIGYKPGGLFAARFKAAEYDGDLNGASCKVLVAGNSRVEEFQRQIASVVGWLPEGIGGSKAKDWVVSIDNVLTGYLFWRTTQMVLEDTGGNDAIGGESAENIISMKVELRSKIQAKGLRHGIIEIVPLAGDSIVKNLLDVNARILAVNAKMKAMFPEDFLSLCDTELAAVGGQKGNPNYFVSDGIHFDANAWPILYREFQKFISARLK